jgi:sulfotransferase
MPIFRPPTSGTRRDPAVKLHNRLHFISGLPRSGSTLLSALLRQNPRFQAGMTSPVGGLLMSMQREMSQRNEGAVFLDDTRRRRLLAGLFDGYYGDVAPENVIFDTNRLWCSKLPTLADLCPPSRVICCVRDYGWVVDSIERLVRRNHLQPSGMFEFNPGGTVFSRAEQLAGPGGMAGYALNALREAVYSDESDRLLLLRYETLTTEPARAMEAIYDFIGEPLYPHRFTDIEFDDAREFDTRIGTPGLHDIGRDIRPFTRTPVLPPELFNKLNENTFWNDPKRYPEHIPVV